MRGILCTALGVLAATLQCKHSPYGSLVVIVDTDVAVPRIVSRLRVDLYTPDGNRWLSSREFGRPDPSDWPASFVAWNPDYDHPHAVLVRLRAFPVGVTRDYLGERFTPRPLDGNPADVSPIDSRADLGPRLLDASARDMTPASEPDPHVTIDQLVLVDIEAGTLGAVRVLLRGACMGTMADLGSLTTCIDQENVRVPTPSAVVDEDRSLRPSTQGTFAPLEPCTADLRAPRVVAGTPLHDDEVCVPGGSFLFGNTDGLGGVEADTPLRMVVLRPFRMDRFEVSVARWRDAVARGFASPDFSPAYNEMPLENDPAYRTSCTWTHTLFDRETVPINCISVGAARAFCRFEGGDLPSEAEWEWVAQAVGRSHKTAYPWGDMSPDCTRTVYGRELPTMLTSPQCMTSTPGVQPVDSSELDRAVGTGVVGLAGNVSELLRDAYATYDKVCWQSQGLARPECDDANAPNSVERGGAWSHGSDRTAARFRTGVTREKNIGQADVGFRCMRPIP